MNKLSAPSSETRKATAISTRSYRHVIIMAIVYAAWLSALLYIGWVNHQAGNQ